VDSFFVDDAGKAMVQDCESLTLGALTMAFRLSKRMKGHIAGLKEGSYQGDKAASFDKY
jgi:Cu/Ag efflux protein CusF